MRRLALVALVLLLGACGRAEGVAETRRALERAGLGHVEVSLRTGGGIGVARIDAAAGSAEQAAEIVWGTLPVRFDTLVVVVGGQTVSFSYEDLAGRFGDRDPSLDGRQVDEEVVQNGLRLMLLLSAAAILSVGAVVATGLLALRAARRGRRGAGAQDAGPTSGLGAGSLTAEGAAGSEADEMPS